MANPSIVITALDQASPTIARIRGNLGELLNSFGGFGSLANKFSLPLLGVAAAVAGIGAAVANAKSVVTWVDNLAEAGSALGLTVQSLASYQQIAKEAGVETEALTMGFNKLSKQSISAASGNKDAVAFFKALGVSVKDASGNVRGFDAILLDTARAFDTFSGGPAKAALQLEAFGRSGTKMDDFLKKAASGLQRNTGLTDDFVKKAIALQDELDKLSAAWTRFSTVLAGPVVNAVTAVLNAFNLLEKAPLQALGDQIAKVKEKLGKEGYWSQRLAEFKFGSRDVAALTTELKSLEAQYEALQMAGFGGGPMPKKNAPVVEDASIASAAEAARKKAQAMAEAIAKEELEWRKKGQQQEKAHEDEFVANNVRRVVERQQADAAYAASKIEWIERIEQAEADAFREGQEILNKRQADEMKLVEDRIDSLISVSDSFFMQLTNAEGTDVFKVLQKDLTQLVYRMLILEPILERIRSAMKSIATQKVDSGGGWWSLISAAIGAFAGGGGSGAVAAGAFDAALGGPANFAQIVGEAGPELFIPKSAGTIVPNHMAGGSMGGVSIVNNNIIDSRTDRGTIAAMLESNRQATLRDVREQLARRGAMLRV